VSAQVLKTDELYLEIVEMDRALFEAFNNRDLQKQETIFAQDIEFFHDQGGMSKYDQLIENTKRLFAQNNELKRTLVPSSLENLSHQGLWCPPSRGAYVLPRRKRPQRLWDFQVRTCVAKAARRLEANACH
jgi:hypothetical protein